MPISGGSGGGASAGAWQTLTPATNWSTKAGYAALAYRMLTPSLVELRGVITNSAGSSGQFLASALPAEARPATARGFNNVLIAAGGAARNFTVNTNGTMTQTTAATGDYGFDGIIYSTS